MKGYRKFVRRLRAINSLGIMIMFLQNFHQSMPGNESFAWDHVVVWSSVTIAQSFHLHFYDPQLYSGELILFVHISDNKLPLNSKVFYFFCYG